MTSKYIEDEANRIASIRKLCKDCKHIVLAGLYTDPAASNFYDHARCDNPEYTQSKVNYVTGEHERSLPFAELMRGVSVDCGPDGKGWSAQSEA